MPHDTALPLLRQRPGEPRACPLAQIAADPAHPRGHPEALYIHTPFCFHKCHYCDFYSIVDTRDRQLDFAARLAEELHALGQWHGRPTDARPLRSIFVGGGTPTLMGETPWHIVLDALHRAFEIDPDAEFTVECNPETASPDLLALLASRGVNRLSIGAQSFDPALLKVLERWHDPDNVPRAVEIARGAGIANLSLDLIYAIPGQSLDQWQSDLDRALALQPSHLSCYCLTYEPGTAMTRRLELGQVHATPDDLAADMQMTTFQVLQDAGLNRYEVSNFARPGAECRHNLAYWRQHPWLAAGPSASAHVAGHRWKNVPHLDKYLASARASPLPPVIDHELPDARRALVELLMTGLRITEGVDAARVLEDGACISAQTPGRLSTGASVCESRAWLDVTPTRWKPTDAGMLFADAIAIEFMSALDRP